MVSGRSQLRRVADRVGRKLLQPGSRRVNQEIYGERNPDHPELLPGFRFFAVLGAWMEEDIIESNVRNAFVQGAEKVFLLDNGSTDATVERALAAGATLAETYEVGSFQEEVRTVLMNGVVIRESLASLSDHVWWLYLDADEFPEGPGGMTILEYLGTLDQRFRLVGTTYYNHFPTGKPENLPGVHPVDLQPMCTTIPFSYCRLGHYKHPLQRFDRYGVYLRAEPGFHKAATRSGERLLEPEVGIVTHHVQYRQEAVTRSNLERLCDPVHSAVQCSLGHRAYFIRRASLNAVYSQRWDEVDNRGNWGERAPLGVTLQPWTGAGTRWYDSLPEEVSTRREP
jgi:hypothetical protein